MNLNINNNIEHERHEHVNHVRTQSKHYLQQHAKEKIKTVDDFVSF
jgi:hypothetical protein